MLSNSTQEQVALLGIYQTIRFATLATSHGQDRPIKKATRGTVQLSWAALSIHTQLYTTSLLYTVKFTYLKHPLWNLIMHPRDQCTLAYLGYREHYLAVLRTRLFVYKIIDSTQSYIVWSTNATMIGISNNKVAIWCHVNYYMQLAVHKLHLVRSIKSHQFRESTLTRHLNI